MSRTDAFSRLTNPTLLTAIQNALVLASVLLVIYITNTPVALLGLMLRQTLPVLSIDHYAVSAGIVDANGRMAGMQGMEDELEDERNRDPIMGFTATLRPT